ncbi:hypothetical protein Ddye_022145 [Dipteronia dyeriana]|uniref:Reverse transcriptase n=1 Tax=Dipteronia dyeriana TaxID=168575 RepID=A0AAD9WYN0_9ROSI|nr:hypothetical protein Ddye_022145 [Dipteronia dyeriana]
MRFTAEEVRLALFQMSPSNALGIDRFPVDLYHKFWDAVGEDVMKMCFVDSKGRLITDNTMVSFECMHALRWKVQGKKGFMSLKLDMFKAYDRVEWSFLEGMLHWMGFPKVDFVDYGMCVLCYVLIYMAKSEVMLDLQEGYGKAGSGFLLWKSLLWGRELLEKGSRWRVGNGKSICIYKDRWIPRQSTFQVFSLHVLGENATIDSLKLLSGIWNFELVWGSFLEDDAKMILSVPPCSNNSSDSLLWHYYSSGLTQFVMVTSSLLPLFRSPVAQV